MENLVMEVSRRCLDGWSVSDEALWYSLRNLFGGDPRVLWEQMLSVTRERVTRLSQAGDVSAAVPLQHRMTHIDWLVLDLVIVHLPSQLLAQIQDECHQSRLLELATRFELESCDSHQQRAVAWRAATHHYNQQGWQSSPMLLQRRWFLLKAAARDSALRYWRRRVPAPALHVALATRFPTVVTGPPLDWTREISTGLIVLPDKLEQVTEEEVERMVSRVQQQEQDSDSEIEEKTSEDDATSDVTSNEAGDATGDAAGDATDSTSDASDDVVCLDSPDCELITVDSESDSDAESAVCEDVKLRQKAVVVTPRVETLPCLRTLSLAPLALNPALYSLALAQGNPLQSGCRALLVQRDARVARRVSLPDMAVVRASRVPCAQVSPQPRAEDSLMDLLRELSRSQPPPPRYCCAARRDITSRRPRPHPCPPNRCRCCCRLLLAAHTRLAARPAPQPAPHPAPHPAPQHQLLFVDVTESDAATEGAAVPPDPLSLWLHERRLLRQSELSNANALHSDTKPDVAPRRPAPRPRRPHLPARQPACPPARLPALAPKPAGEPLLLLVVPAPSLARCAVGADSSSAVLSPLADAPALSLGTWSWARATPFGECVVRVVAEARALALEGGLVLCCHSGAELPPPVTYWLVTRERTARRVRVAPGPEPLPRRLVVRVLPEDRLVTTLTPLYRLADLRAALADCAQLFALEPATGTVRSLSGARGGPRLVGAGGGVRGGAGGEVRFSADQIDLYAMLLAHEHDLPPHCVSIDLDC